MDEDEDSGLVAIMNTELSFLLSISVFRNSLSGMLQVVDFILRRKEGFLIGLTDPFWTFLLKCPRSVTDEKYYDNSALAYDILCAIESNTKLNDRLFPISSSEDAKRLVGFIEGFGCRNADTRYDCSANAWARSSSICEKAAAILQANVLRVMHTVPIQKRVTILGDLGGRLKSAIDAMLHDDGRDPSTDPGLAQCILLYASIKDILLPDFKQQVRDDDITPVLMVICILQTHFLSISSPSPATCWQNQQVNLSCHTIDNRVPQG